MTYSEREGWSAVTGLSSLDDPVRRRLYEYVIGCDGPAARDDAAAAVGISRTLAAYHLDKLADADLLETSYARTPGRGGPGAGRPAKRYRPAAGGLHVSVPPREYRLLAELLATAADGSGELGVRLAQEARATGNRTGAAFRGDVVAALRRCGYRPHVARGEGRGEDCAEGRGEDCAEDCDEGRGEGVELRNCPFRAVVEQHRELICGLNLQLVRGVLEGNGEEGGRAVLDPAAGRCCVRVTGRSS